MPLSETGFEHLRDYRESSSMEGIAMRPDGNLLLVEKLYASWCDADSDVKYGTEEYEEYQKKQYFIPTNKNVFESQLAKAMKVEYEKDANGNYKLDENGERIKQPYGYYYDGMQRVDVYAITESQAQMLRETIANTTRLLNFDQSIDGIVSEGAQAFFKGQKSAEECAKLIQSKVNIYVNERK